MVGRYNTIEEMFNVFSKQVRQKFLSFTFKRCTGVDANVPTSFTDTEAEWFETTITQAYIPHNVPLAKAVFEYFIFDNARNFIYP